MKLEIRTVKDPEECLTLAEAAENIRRSPHVGNVNGRELMVIDLMRNLAGDLAVELVDTVRMSDDYSTPRQVLAGRSIVPIIGQSHKSKVVSSPQPIKPDAVEDLQQQGIPCKVGQTVSSLHINNLEAAMPDAQITTATQELASAQGLGVDVAGLLTTASTVIDRPLRTVNANGKIREAGIQHAINDDAVLGLGDNAQEGLMPPVEMMCAVDILTSALAAGGQDVQALHVGGPDMIRYMADPDMQAVVAKIVQESTAGQNFGIVEYVVPCMKGLTTAMLEAGYETSIREGVKSQHHLLQIRSGHVEC